jgi:carbamoyltransferase
LTIHRANAGMTTILGINAFHGDSAAALVRDGELIAACEEERYNRIKHWAGFPAESVRRCLKIAGLGIEDVDHVALSFDPGANLLRRLWYLGTHPGTWGRVGGRLSRQGRGLGVSARLAEVFGVERVRARVHRVEHHHAHLASAFLLSGWEEAAVLSVDGMGDFTSTVLAGGFGSQIREYGRVYHPHSLGLLYNAVTLFLGFPAYGDEYKVMGLAPYGVPDRMEVFERMVRPTENGFELDLSYFRHHREGVAMSWDGGIPVVKPFHSARMERELGPARLSGDPLTARHENIAASLQAVTEKMLFHLLRRLHALNPGPRLCLAGGVAMNSVANGKIVEKTPFREVYVPAGAADNGTAMGAAFHVWSRVLGGERRFRLRHGYWGDAVGEDAAEAAVRGAGLGGRRLSDEELVERVVQALVDGRVVGWFQGRMEFGARALGNRSLLADPRRKDMRELINLRIKFREKFRPFAPSVLAERAGEWFEAVQDSPVMEKVLVVRPEKRGLIPAVVHVDGTGRLQTVEKETNPLYHRLIETFEDRTGVPMVLNTSLNENEPIVQTAEQAVSCFLRTEMDVLVIGSWWMERGGAGMV